MAICSRSAAEDFRLADAGAASDDTGALELAPFGVAGAFETRFAFDDFFTSPVRDGRGFSGRDASVRVTGVLSAGYCVFSGLGVRAGAVADCSLDADTTREPPGVLRGAGVLSDLMPVEVAGRLGVPGIVPSGCLNDAPFSSCPELDPGLLVDCVRCWLMLPESSDW